MSRHTALRVLALLLAFYTQQAGSLCGAAWIVGARLVPRLAAHQESICILPGRKDTARQCVPALLALSSKATYKMPTRGPPGDGDGQKFPFQPMIPRHKQLLLADRLRTTRNLEEVLQIVEEHIPGEGGSTRALGASLGVPREMHWRDAAVAMHQLKHFEHDGQDRLRVRQRMAWLGALVARELHAAADGRSSTSASVQEQAPPRPPSAPQPSNGQSGAGPVARDRWGKPLRRQAASIRSTGAAVRRGGEAGASGGGGAETGGSESSDATLAAMAVRARAASGSQVSHGVRRDGGGSRALPLDTRPPRRPRRHRPRQPPRILHQTLHPPPRVLHPTGARGGSAPRAGVFSVVGGGGAGGAGGGARTAPARDPRGCAALSCDRGPSRPPC
ncbi:hypothetical protein T484DRAFT_3043870 [Baffinella frigidus]|nr:hypothetical protein T484DRAFT_3043870 [Cryptophyta sp. CCMP2293]